MDVAEYTRVKEALDKAESTARSAVAEAEKKLAAATTSAKEAAEKAVKELAAVTAKGDKSASQLEIAKKHLKLYNPEGISPKQWKESQAKLKARAAELEEKLAAWEKEKAELEAKATEAVAAAEAAAKEDTAMDVDAAPAEWAKEKAELEAKLAAAEEAAAAAKDPEGGEGADDAAMAGKNSARWRRKNNRWSPSFSSRCSSRRRPRRGDGGDGEGERRT